MKKLLLVSTLSFSTLVIANLPAHAQFVSIPITNGTFTITNNAGTLGYTTLPTFLSPAGTLTITSATVNNMVGYSALIPVTVNTPTGFVDINTYSGSATLNDGRTATFTGGGASLRGTATVTGGSLPATAGDNSPFPMAGWATFTYTAQSGAVHIPQSSLGAYSTPQFTIPVSGGSFTLTDSPGTGNITGVLNSVLTPLGTEHMHLTINLSNLGGSGTGGFATWAAAYYPTAAAPLTLSGVASGGLALHDGLIASLDYHLMTLTANTQVVAGFPAGGYFPGGQLLIDPVTIQGTITGGTISIPQSHIIRVPTGRSRYMMVWLNDVLQHDFPGSDFSGLYYWPVLPPVQPPVVPPVQPPVTPPSVVLPAPPPPRQEFVLGLDPSLNLGGDPEAYLQLVEVEPQPVLPDDLPEMEQSPLAFSRIHPGCNSYTR